MIDDAFADDAAVRLGEPRRFVIWMLSATAFIVLAIVAGNWLVDPYGVWHDKPLFGQGVFDDRSRKMELLRAAEPFPDVVILGSSRMLKYDPDVLEPALGDNAFNASIVNGTILDMRLMVEFIRAEAQRRDEPMPQIVYGIDAETFRDGSVNPAIMRYDELFSHLSWRQRWKVRFEQLGNIAQLQGLKDSLTLVRQRVFERDRWRPTAPTFRPDGYRKSGARERVAKFRDLEKEVAGTANDYVAQYESEDPRRLHPQARREFEALLRIAGEGDTPIVFLTPMHPTVARAVAGKGREERLAVTRRYLDGVAERVRVEWYDLTDVTGMKGAETEWYDGVHPTPRLATPLLERLLELRAS